MMRTYRGVVFEIEKKYTVFLTEKGEFLRGIPIGGAPNIGDEVDFHLINTPSFLSRKVKPRLLGTVMLAAVLLLSILASLIPMGDEVMAYVQLESDTAVELGVNKTGKVIVLRYLNGTSVESVDRDSLDPWKGDSVSKVLVTALKNLTTKDSGGLVNITIIYENTKNQQKVQKIVGNAVREIQSANKELTLRIGESTAEERVMANKHEMSVYKFQESQQVSPKKEIKPSSENSEDMKNNPSIEHGEKVTPINKESVPSVPANEKVNGNENDKEINGNEVQKSNESIEKPMKEQKESPKSFPLEKGKSSNSEQGNVNSNKDNRSPAPQQPKEHKNEQKQPGNANSANQASKTKDLPHSP